MDELNEHGDSQDGLEEGPSKSQIKRDWRDLQDLAERLVALPRTDLERLGLSEATWAAIEEKERIKDQRALRRHYKRIAKLLAREDLAAAQALMGEKDRLTEEAAVRHHRIERWRDRLMEEGDVALGELLSEWPGVDRQQLRTLVRAARRDREQGKSHGARRLFRLLRDELDRMELDT
jgi:ribosome-associated protein